MIRDLSKPFPVFFSLSKISHSQPTISKYTHMHVKEIPKERKNGVLRRKAIAGKNLYRRIREPIPRILTPSPGLYSQGIKSYKGIEIAHLYFNITTRNKQIYRHQNFHLLRPSTISADTHQGPIKAPYDP